ncbi:Terpenoid cyclases/Protein prenyltransferases superfamily protein [Perilla frutescens var. hirtella]|uniref:Terpenoid cyclases/Protein prenyltransferases superfamily protein n=1 Tax=Perilla frutescens var. hirtella TaxID=608512 RepID=A0AAD4J2R8_PERFH|nr:Terpenoid cyclases/Protein prenyltransferases superfamily protein [Perilla frutescens var. hirtella]
MSFVSNPISFLPSSTTHGDLSAAAALCIPSLPRSSAACLPLFRPSVTSTSSLQCNAISRPRTEDYIDVIQNGLPVIKWHEIVEDDEEKDSLKKDKIKELANVVRSMLQSMGDGEISVSPYDTAWVALVEDVGGGRRPQFPSSLEWISNNQFPDGSWGDRTFSICDRIINTLACVVALRSWNVHPDKTDKGIWFIKKNINRIDEESEEHMPIGFEVALPSLIEIAKKLEIDIPNDTRGLREIYARREIKLKKIPGEIMHQVPTTLLHSLEGMGGLKWQKLLKLQSEDGSFLFSPSSTAFALQQTKDNNCLKYLTKHIHKFNGGVPNVYPVDLFEHLWAVDRLQRLGVSRFFQPEIDECIAYVHRYWTEKGICWSRISEVQDIDDTAMGFRLLRLHGYQVSADVFKHFESGGEFFCFKGQSTQAVTGMYNLYRASQLIFPGENILADAALFSAKFLQQKRANNDLLDKWVITKDLPGEVGYALDVPWYASLPRVETRFYLEQYGGEDDVWIGKTLYRMPYVNNNKYLELAKLDYNNCQALHQQEWKDIQKWYRSCNLGEFGLSERKAVEVYHVAAASVFEPEKSQERLAWVKTAILMETITSHFDLQQLSRDQRRAFVNEFEYGSILKYANGGRYKTRSSLVGTLLRTLNQLSLDILLAHGHDIHPPLKNAWHKWLKTWEEGGGDVELLVQTLNLSGGGGRRRRSCASDELLSSHPKYEQLSKLTSSVCDKLRLFQHRKMQDGNGCMGNAEGITTLEIESEMRELVKLVVTKSSGDLDSGIKRNFLIIARSFYYAAYCNPGTINFHISKVLFERVLL